MADTQAVQDVDAVAQMLDDELDTDLIAAAITNLAIASGQSIDAITPKITVHHGDNN